MIDANVLNEKVADTSAPARRPDADADAGIRVRATKVGFYGIVRAVGEVFTMPAGSKGSWFVPVEKTASVEKSAIGKTKGAVLSDVDLV